MEWLVVFVPFAFAWTAVWLRRRWPETSRRERLYWAGALMLAAAVGVAKGFEIDAIRGAIWGVSLLTELGMAAVVIVEVRAPRLPS